MLSVQSGTASPSDGNLARLLTDVVAEHKQVLLFGIVALAVLLRLPGLVNDGLWRDEGNVYVLATSADFNDLLQRIIQTQWHPPLFFILVYFWVKAVGANEFTLKILPFVGGTLTVPFVYRLGKEVANDVTGIVAAAMYAISPLAITYAAETLYPVMALLATVLAWLVARYRKGPTSPAQLVSVSLVTALATYTHYMALVYVPLLVLWAFAPGASARTRLSLAGVMLVGALPFSPWFPVMLSQLHTGLPYRPEISITEQAWFFVGALSRIVPAWPPSLQWVVFASSVVALFVSARTLLKNIDAVAVTVLFFAILGFVTIKGLTELRYVFPFYGLFCVFLSFMTTQFVATVRSQDPEGWRRAGRFAIAVLVALAVGGAGAYAVMNSDTPKSGIRTLVASQPLSSRTLYVIAPDYLSSTFVFYSRNEHVNFRGFVRVDHPELFRIPTYATEWNRADALENALKAIEQESIRYDYIDLIIDDNARDSGRMPYGKVWKLLRGVEGRYRLLGHIRFPGRSETVSEYKFRASES